MIQGSTQKFLEIDQIKEGVVILKNKGLRGILAVSSLNFALKSEEEQNALLYQFQNFLNSLDFSCQIVIQSRRVNLTGYLDHLEEIEKNEENELLKIQINEYRKFIKSFIERGKIMKKNFFVVVPFAPSEIADFQQKEIFKKPKIPVFTEELFQRCRVQLFQRMEFIILGLRRCNLQAIPLTTPEIIELFWSHFHPKEAEIGYYPEIPPEIIS